MNRVAVIDYGMGNLHSVAKAIEHVGENLQVCVTADEKTIMDAHRIIFPGVGAMRDCMGEIKRLGIDDMLRRLVEDRPVFGICVGMQALLEHSEENNGIDCIGLIKGNVKRFPENMSNEQGERLKVPHMGWNEVTQTSTHPMWSGIADGSRFYFVHSYYVVPESADEIVGESSYPETFTAALAAPNVFAVQFHPEKSQTAGLQLYKNFLSWDGGC
ncbi:MAG: imidazole glycerol phosphate synthase subunit HisH [Gammaproteobacteria bacterium]|jgi:glutamine amidotransferase|nr:imidazole glycerol phosphate synthase subunit HisH [Gammaproteobacteria bacterium]